MIETNNTNDYINFLEKKSQLSGNFGFNSNYMPNYLFDFQKFIIDWALKKGRAAIFADCGLGKTPMQLVWAENIIRKTNKPVLLLTPLAVSHQTLEESIKFNIEAEISGNGKPSNNITITNYEKLHLFNANDYAGLVCDESSILKSFDGAYKKEITQFMKKLKYRLLCTATAAPNDYIELGTSSEALGYMGYFDMLNKFFKNDSNNSAVKRMFGKTQMWRFKGHAETAFWQWIASWARAIRKPSDFGFENNGFVLPGIKENNHLIEFTKPPDGFLFNMPAIGLDMQREERRRTIKERCEKVAELVSKSKSALIWCNLNEEGDLLEKIIPDALQVAGKHRDEIKEERLLGFKKGFPKILITKPKIGAWGLNYQHCSHITYFPTHSYEQYYQGIRRCYRFGQKKKVIVDFVTTEGDEYVFKNLLMKTKRADKMFDSLITHMNKEFVPQIIQYTNKEIIPQWLKIN